MAHKTTARKSTSQKTTSRKARRTTARRPAEPVGHVERERKYEGDAAAALPSLADVPLTAGDGAGAEAGGLLTAVAAESESLRAVYYDTPDLRLLARRITLRRRTGGHDAGWHLKLPAADGARLELHLPLDASTSTADPDAPPDVPPEFLTRVRAYVRDGRLAPVARLATERRRTLLTDGADRTLVELADDSVTAQALDPAGAVRHAESWHEVEAELVDGDTPLLDAVERRLLKAGLRRSASASKLARALGPTAPTRPEAGRTTESSPGSIGALLTALLRQQVGQFLAQDAEVRRDTPDAVHQMRVCARRLRSTLRVHERLLRVDEVAGLEEELRWLGHALGTARDREVLGERLLRDLDTLHRTEHPGPMRRRLRNWSRQGYRTAWRQTVRELEGPRYFALLEALDALAAHPPLRGRADRPAAKEVPRLLTREQHRACHRVAAALDLTPGTPERDDAMHAARRAAKRARYAGEGAAQPRFAKVMKDLQTVLGERQDAFMAAQALPGLAEAAHRAGEPGFGYGVLYARQREAITAAEAEVPARQAAASAIRVK
ncbi:CYTH and CHAD domain-containing protein [Streptacidiphilus melanogenes]|uniref:CYTH and CHAD domain-containing protein n=1 Tax=Streptacidiphilus melanogenes TaxID=411235 RepID=UPI000694A00A|nr:CYTH and CHAD domain-containing protein [Streptacidiphilus melanogenes]